MSLILEELEEKHQKNFLNAIEDWRAGDPSSLEVFGIQDGEWTSTRFAKFLKESEKRKLDWRPGPNKVSETRYVFLEKEARVVALGLMSFPLDEKSELGNLVVSVPPSLRKKAMEVIVSRSCSSKRFVLVFVEFS